VTIPPVVTPLLQWSDANGTPYANGTVTTYIVGTGTPKQTWADPDQTSPNANPIVLDAAGRSQMWGDGDYRLVLRDAADNLVADFPATSLVSAAMYPVVSAPTIADAVSAMGIDTLISDEAAARAAADAAEQNAREAADADLTNTILNTINGVDLVNADLAAEVTRATGAEATLQTNIDTITATVASHPSVAITIQGGIDTLDLDGHKRVTFPTAFPTAWTSFVATVVASGTSSLQQCVVMFTADVFGADVYMMQNGVLTGQTLQFSWMATGY
jgi:hypothetical protein